MEKIGPRVVPPLCLFVFEDRRQRLLLVQCRRIDSGPVYA